MQACVRLDVCLCVHFFEEASKDFSPSGEERNREKKRRKKDSHVMVYHLFSLAILFIFCKRF